MKKINFKKLVASLKERGSRDPLKREIAPYRTWRIIVLCFWGAFVASAFFGAYLFLGVRNEDLFNINERKEQGAVLDVAKLSEVVKTFDNKETTLESLRKNNITQVDPSR